jgi:hypothetical protein
MISPWLKYARIAILFLAAAAISCSTPADEGEGDKGFYVEEYRVLLPRLYGFEKLVPELRDAREILLCRKGDAYIWLSRLSGFLTSSTAEDQLSEIWVLAQERIYNEQYLKGTRVIPGNLKRVSHATRPHIEQLLIVERTPELTALLNEFDRQLHAHEIKRFPIGSKMLLVNYYAPVDDSIYVLAFAARPDDFLFLQEDVKKIFLEMQLNVVSRPAGY